MDDTKYIVDGFLIRFLALLPGKYARWLCLSVDPYGLHELEALVDLVGGSPFGTSYEHIVVPVLNLFALSTRHGNKT